MRRTLNLEWLFLCDAIDQVEAQMAANPTVKPTPQMCKLLIVGEDRRFHRHIGIDVIALCRAIWRTLCGSRQGGSTIAMQLVRTLTGRFERTWQRKVREMALAVLLTRRMNKEKIPYLYLWVAYYGWRMNGFGQACRRLGLNASQMNHAESAKLVARLKYPEPRVPSPTRLWQIERRARHLILLTDEAPEARVERVAGKRWSHSG